MAKMNLKVRTRKCQENSCVRYVIIYTNDKMVQRHRVYCLVSRVNIFLQMNVQRITLTSPMQVSTIVLYYLCGIVGLVLGCQFHSCRELLEFPSLFK